MFAVSLGYEQQRARRKQWLDALPNPHEGGQTAGHRSQEDGRTEAGIERPQPDPPHGAHLGLQADTGQRAYDQELGKGVEARRLR